MAKTPHLLMILAINTYIVLIVYVVAWLLLMVLAKSKYTSLALNFNVFLLISILLNNVPFNYIILKKCLKKMCAQAYVLGQVIAFSVKKDSLKYFEFVRRHL